MEGVTSKDVGVPDAGGIQPQGPQSNNVPVPISADEPIDFDAEAEALAEEEATDVPEQDDFDELDQALTPGPEREDQNLRIPFLCGFAAQILTNSGAFSYRILRADSRQVYCGCALA